MSNVIWLTALCVILSVTLVICIFRNRFLKVVIDDLQRRNGKLKDDLKVGLNSYKLTERAVFLANIHGLKNTFLGIRMVASGELPTPEAEKTLENIGNASKDALNQIHKTLKNCFHLANPGELPVLVSARFSPLDILQKIKKQFNQDLRYSRCCIAIELAKKTGQEEDMLQNRLDNFRGNELLLESIFTQLITNACEAITAGDKKNKTITVLIDLVFKESEEWLKFSITNEGRIPPALMEKFLKKPVDSTKENGSGVGAYLAEALTRSMRGKIRLEISDNKNVEISIEIPTIASLEH
jgi:signal transduction histidine kinase